jgi:hypothetical protein
LETPRVLYAIAESCPFDSLLVMDMKKAVNALLQLNLKRFRVQTIPRGKNRRTTSEGKREALGEDNRKRSLKPNRKRTYAGRI